MTQTNELHIHRDEILAEMHGWIIDAFGMDIADSLVGEDELMAAVERHYAGGTAGFISDQRF